MQAIIVVLVLLGLIVFLTLFTYFIPVGLWISAYFSGVRVRIFKDLVGMRLRRVPPQLIIRPMISATKAGLDVDIDRCSSGAGVKEDPRFRQEFSSLHQRLHIAVVEADPRGRAEVADQGDDIRDAVCFWLN